MLLSILLFVATSSCHRTEPRTRPFPKNTGERELEVQGTTKPAQLGGPLEPVGDTSFTGRKSPHLDVDIMQLNEHDLVQYLQGLVYDRDPQNGEIETVACIHATPTGDVPCAPNDGVRLYIEPEIGAHLWNHGDYASVTHGAIIARILNYEKDDRKEATFGFPAHTKVWWLVDLDPVSHQPRSRFFKRTYSSGPPFLEQVGGDHPFVDCGHVHKVKHAEAIAKYVSCGQSLTMDAPRPAQQSSTATSGSGSVFRLASFKPAVPLPSRPMVMMLNATWITCDMGCCSTTQ